MAWPHDLEQCRHLKAATQSVFNKTRHCNSFTEQHSHCRTILTQMTHGALESSDFFRQWNLPGVNFSWLLAPAVPYSTNHYHTCEWQLVQYPACRRIGWYEGPPLCITTIAFALISSKQPAKFYLPWALIILAGSFAVIGNTIEWRIRVKYTQRPMPVTNSR